MEATVPFSLSENGEYALYSSPDGVLKLWETVTGVLKQQYTPSAHLSSTCTCLSWSPTERAMGTPKKKKQRRSKSRDDKSPDVVAVGTTSGNILIYSTKLGDLQTQLSDGHSSRVNDLCWKEDDLSLYSCSDDSHIVNWNVSKNHVNQKWKADKGSIHSICLCSNHHLLSAGRTIKLWNTQTQQLIKKFTGHATEIFKLLPIPFTMNSTPDSIDNVYFLSAAISDRIVNAWHVNTQSSDKTAVASFSLPDEPVMLDISRKPTKDQNVLLSVVTKSGQVQIFEHMLNGKLKQPVKPKVTIQIATPGLKDNIPKPVPILAVHSCDDHDNNILIVHGNFLKPVFEKVPYNSKESEVCLIRDNLDKSAVKLETSVSKVKTPEVSKDLTVLVPGTMVPTGPSHEGGGRRKRRQSSVTEMSMEDRLNAISMDSESSKAVKAPPKADNLARLLTQGLQSHDKKIINNVLSQRKDDVIKKTVKRLPVQAIVPLVHELTRIIQGRSASCQNAVKWIKTLLAVHMSYLMTYPDVVETMSSLYQMMDSRTAMFSQLSRLQGKLDLILSQISSQEHQAEEEDTAAGQPLLLYQEESSDEDALEDFGNSQSDNSFDDMDLFDSDTEAAAENGDEEMVSD